MPIENPVDVQPPHFIFFWLHHCRELGLPCVVSIEGATTSIPDGATIEVDGNTGQVTVVDVPS